MTNAPVPLLRRRLKPDDLDTVWLVLVAAAGYLTLVDGELEGKESYRAAIERMLEDFAAAGGGVLEVHRVNSILNGHNRFRQRLP